MINLEFTGMCAGCKVADLELTVLESFSGGKIWSASCVHRRACIAASDKIKDELAQANRAIEGRPKDE